MKRMRDEDGNALLEFALLLPMLVFVLLAAVDFSLVIQRSMLVTDAAANGIKYGILLGNNADLIGMQTAAMNAAPGLSGLSAVASSYCSCTPGGAAVSCSSTCSPYISPVEYVTVTTSATVPLLFGVSGLPGSFPLSSTSTARIPWQ